MNKVLPIVIICGVGIALAFAYVAALAVRAIFAKKRGKRPRNEFEIEEDTLVIKLGKKRKKK